MLNNLRLGRLEREQEKKGRQGEGEEVEKDGWDADGKSVDRLSVSRDIADALRPLKSPACEGGWLDQPRGEGLCGLVARRLPCRGKVTGRPGSPANNRCGAGKRVQENRQGDDV